MTAKTRHKHMPVVHMKSGEGPKQDCLSNPSTSCAPRHSGKPQEESPHRTHSPMSMRTIIFSSSKSSAASALASSVLPTPVGPRNRKDAPRLRAARPARVCVARVFSVCAHRCA